MQDDYVSVMSFLKTAMHFVLNEQGWNYWYVLPWTDEN